MDFILNIFWNKNEKRVRAGFRIALLLFTLSLVSYPFRLIMQRPEDPANASIDYIIFKAISGFIAILVSAWIITRFIDRRRFSNVGLQLDKIWWMEFSFGLLLGIVLMSSIFFIEYGLGWITLSESIFTSNNPNFSVLAFIVFFIMFLSVGFNEELLTRGYLLTNLAEGLNFKSIGPKGSIYISWILTSVLFGIGHLGNPNATWVAGLNIAAAGIFLGVGFVLTGRLALPIGVHITWNFFQGNVFGFPVSGINTLQGSKMTTIVQGGPEIWTGGSFGPEAGLIGICAIISGTILSIAWVRVREGSIKIHLPIAEPPKIGELTKSVQEKND